MSLLRTKKKATRGIARSSILISALVLTFSLAACGDDIQFQVEKIDTTPKVAESDKAAADKETEAPEVDRDYIYTSIGKRDPFRSIFDEIGGETALSPDETILSPLQGYDINSFTVTAILWGISSPAALVRTADGKTFIVKTGTLMGRNWGRVVKIKSDSIVVLEQRPLPNGTKVSNLIELKLPVNAIKPQESEVELPEESEESKSTEEDLIERYSDRP